jgi:putative colanic acid biosynthesis acetyltransferase WcaF
MIIDPQINRTATKYSKRELLSRVLWWFARFIFCATPRPCFGLRRWILRLFGAQVGKGVNIYPSVNIYFPWNLEIGDNSAIGEWALIYNLGKIKIGERATISQRVHLCAGTHDYKSPAMTLLKPPIEIGNDVWVCADAFVGPNIKIAESAIVAAASVVVKDVGASQIVGGNPAKLIKIRSK